MSERAALSASLRQTAERIRGWTYSGDSEPDPRVLMRDAADEIDRLQRHIENMRRET